MLNSKALESATASETVSLPRSHAKVISRLSSRLMVMAAAYMLILWLLILQASSVTG